jgi:hypothetical protein
MLTVRRTRHDPGTFLAACVFIVPWTTALCGQTSQHQPTHGVIARQEEAALTRGVANLPEPPTRAAVLVDTRRHALLADPIGEYARAAAARRRFTIALEVIPGLDDLPFAAVRERVRALRRAHPALEGVLFVGNVSLSY